jgi:hypothetical protein
MLLAAILAFAGTVHAQSVNAGGRPLHNEAERLAKWKDVAMPFHAEGLSAGERQMVEKLVEACQLLDNIYWRQMDIGGLAIYKATRNDTLRGLFGIMGSRWDQIDENHPFLGEPPMPPGREFYPHDLTRARLEAYLQQHPEDRAAIYNPYTVVKWRGDRLIGVPYREEYKQFLEPMAKALRDAAALSADPGFAAFLRLRAAALVSDDYYASEVAWLGLKDPKIDIIFSADEENKDGLLGVKTSYGASILIRNEEESRKLALYQRYVPEIQDALPIDAGDRPSKRGHLMPMEVMDAPYRAGDLRYGYQAVADNLPDDPRIHSENGTKKVFFKNFMDARVNYVVIPVAGKLMQPEQAARVTGDGYMTFAIMHEICHGLGPVFAHREGKQVDINEALGPVYGALEEAKADVVGMFALQWMMDHGALGKARAAEYGASYAAGIFRTLRFGTGEPHGRAQMMEFNYLAEQGALSHTATGYAMDTARLPAALAQLAHELLAMEAAGDRGRAETWFAKYDRMPAELKAALAAAAGIPVDIHPIFSFPDKLQ